MRRDAGDPHDPQTRRATDHADGTAWLRQFFEWVLSDDFAHAHATCLIEQQRTKLEQRRQWDREATEVRAYAATIEAVPPDPVAKQLVRDMLRFEDEGLVMWNDWTLNWEKARPAGFEYPDRDPLTADQLLDRFDGVRKIRGGWQARCPAHEDRHPSLSIRRGERWWLTYCHAGCTSRGICDAVGLRIADLALEGHDG